MLFYSVTAIGLFILLISGIWLYFIVRIGSPLSGRYFVFTPVYVYYLAFTRWPEVKAPVILYTMGSLILLTLLIIPRPVKHASELTLTVANFVAEASVKNYHAAYELCSDEYFSFKEIASLIDQNYDFFDRFQKLEIDKIETMSENNYQIRVLKGSIISTGDRKLPFKAELVGEQNHWLIRSFNILKSRP